VTGSCRPLHHLCSYTPAQLFSCLPVNAHGICCTDGQVVQQAKAVAACMCKVAAAAASEQHPGATSATAYHQGDTSATQLTACDIAQMRSTLLLLPPLWTCRNPRYPMQMSMLHGHPLYISQLPVLHPSLPQTTRHAASYRIAPTPWQSGSISLHLRTPHCPKLQSTPPATDSPPTHLRGPSCWVPPPVDLHGAQVASQHRRRWLPARPPPCPLPGIQQQQQAAPPQKCGS
jgi:hypothetical protein